MMITVLFALLILVAGVLFFFWVLRAMLDSGCPKCLEEGNEELVIPIVPGMRWFCPTCGGIFGNEVRGKREGQNESGEDL